MNLRSIAAKLLGSVPFAVYMLMLVCAVLQLHLPQPVYTLTGLIGGANTFLSMLMIGMMFEMTLDLDKLKQVREVVLYRYVFGIALAWLCFYHVPLSAEVKEVLTLVFWRLLRLSARSLLPEWAVMWNWPVLLIP